MLNPDNFSFLVNKYWSSIICHFRFKFSYHLIIKPIMHARWGSILLIIIKESMLMSFKWYNFTTITKFSYFVTLLIIHLLITIVSDIVTDGSLSSKSTYSILLRTTVSGFKYVAISAGDLIMACSNHPEITKMSSGRKNKFEKIK